MARLTVPPPPVRSASADRQAPLVWVTRAEPGAARTAARLRDLAYAPLTAPLLEIRPLPFEVPDISTYDVLAFTSATGVSAFADAVRGAVPEAPVFTVGNATAEAARVAGFSEVRSAEGDGRALCALILAQTSADTRVLNPVASRPAFDLATALRQQDRAARSLAVYETRPVAALPPAARRAIADGALNAILIHSPAAGRALAALAPSLHDGIAIVALSSACAAPVEGLGGRALVASAPNDAALLEALAALRPHTAGNS